MKKNFSNIAMWLNIVNEDIEVLPYNTDNEDFIRSLNYALETLKELIEGTPFTLIQKGNGYYDLTW